MGIFKPHTAQIETLPPVAPDMPRLTVHQTIRNPSGALLEAGDATITKAELGTDAWTVTGTPLSQSMVEFVLPPGVGYTSNASIHLETSKYAPYDAAVVLAPDLAPEAVLRAVPPAHVRRTGIVRGIDHVWVDDQGPFNPLGDTLLHAVGTTHREGLARIQTHGEYFSKFRHDYVRLLCEVSWAGEEIVVTWGDYPLGVVMDCLYDVYGLRSKLSIIGGVSPDPIAAARVVASVIAAGRAEKVFFVEMINEGNGDPDAAVQMVQIIRATGVLCAVGLGNQGLETINKTTEKAKAPVSLLHTERGLGDATEVGGEHARQVRQCWDLRILEGLRENAEPPGPASSVAVLEDPFQLAAMAALSRLCGAGAHCDHTGSGVFGRPMDGAYGHRYANVWEIPNADQIMAWTRNADALLPADIANWAQFNNGHPVETKDGECNKHYGARTGSAFISMPIGCPGTPQQLTARQAVHLKVVNPATTEVLFEGDLSAGQSITVSGLWAYLLIGTLR